MLAELFTSGRLLDLILLLVLFEALTLFLYHRTTGRGPAFATLAPNLVSGAALLLALRLTLAAAWWGWAAGALTLALLAHLWDLARRWPTGGGRAA